MSGERRNGRRAAHRHAPQKQRQHGAVWQRTALFLVATVGLGILTYPPATSWASARAQTSAIAGYSHEVSASSNTTKQRLLSAAEQYNATLPRGLLRDPYTNTGHAGNVQQLNAYEKQLRIGDRDEMGELSIPSISVNLPIYHGTTQAALERGIGHLFGSSLPVGGPGTHAVLTGHSGLPNSTMLTNLSKVKKGAVFIVTTLGTPLYYRVDDVRIVKPDDTKPLQIVPGKDYVTLVTCTPLNVNTHRLLVRGVRIPDPDHSTQTTLASEAAFPWWAIIFLTGEGTFATALFARRRKRRSRPGDVGALGDGPDSAAAVEVDAG